MTTKDSKVPHPTFMRFWPCIVVMIAWLVPGGAQARQTLPQSGDVRVVEGLLAGDAARLELPERPPGALGGSAVVREVAGLGLEAREARLVGEILAGNVPDFLRRFVTVEVSMVHGGRRRTVTLNVMPDVLAVGSDDDFLRVPLSPQAAQAVADRTRASLPTSRISDVAWAAAELRLPPQPIPPSEAMTTLPVFADHHHLIESIWPEGLDHGVLVAGLKKDVVLTPALSRETGRVAIYGWHTQDGAPIQPVYTGHTDRWVDYSHGIRLVSRRVWVDGVEYDLRAILEDSHLSLLLSDDGPIRPARYSTSAR